MKLAPGLQTCTILVRLKISIPQEYSNFDFTNNLNHNRNSMRYCFWTFYLCWYENNVLSSIICLLIFLWLWKQIVDCLFLLFHQERCVSPSLELKERTLIAVKETSRDLSKKTSAPSSPTRTGRLLKGK